MSFFDDASLVMIPSGYKDQKVYSVKPLDGTGDLTFTRSNDTATRVNSAGLIEKVRTNVALYSEDQDSWTNQNQTFVTANAAANPLNGATTADKVIPSAITDDHYRGLSMGSIVGEFTSSIYVKADGYSIIDYGVYNSTASNYPVRAVFDLSTQTITQIDGSVSSITSVGSGWYRISVTASVASTSTMGIFHRVRSTGTSGAYAGDGTSGMLLWGCQLENGVMTDYVGPTTSSAVSVGPVANLPRLDYSGGATCGKLLLEPQRTNLVTYSEQIDNAGWSKLSGAGGSTPIVTANYGLAPDGTMSAERVQLARTTTSFSYSEVKQNFGTSGTQYTVSVYLKSLSGTPTIAIASDGSTFNYLATLTNDWVRYTATFTASGTPSAELILYQQVAATSLTADFLVWGFQAEAGAYASSYINTYGTSATRAQDLSVTASPSTSYFGQTEGTIFTEIKINAITSGLYSRVFNLKNSGGSNQIYIQQNNSRINGVVFNGSNQFSSTTSSGFLSVGSTYKIALAYKNSNYALYINGTQIATGSASGLGTLAVDRVDLTTGSGNIDLGNEVKQSLVFNTRLTNSDLAALTS